MSNQPDSYAEYGLRPVLDNYYLAASEVCDLIRCHRATLDRMVADGRFPKPSRHIPGRVYWKKAQVLHWLDEPARFVPV